MLHNEGQQSFVAFGLVIEPPSDAPQAVSVIQSAYDVPLVPMEETFGEMVVDHPVDRSKVLIVLDCANIGWEYGIDSFSVLGMQLAMDYLMAMEVDIKAFLPASYMRKNGRRAFNPSEDVSLLDKLTADRTLCVVPSGDSDDAYILNYARENNGFVVSNDQYRDHISSLSNPSVQLSMRMWLQENRCGYSFSGSDFVLNPSSALCFALKKHSIMHSKILQSLPPIERHSTGPMQEHILRSLEVVAGELSALNRPHLLEHVLLARCYLLLETGQPQAARDEVQVLLEHINPVSPEGHRILQCCRATNHSPAFS